MDSGSEATGNGKAGGKILKRRQIAARKTPYDRPTTPRQNETPNWINALVFPAKFVAGGASKLLSSVWNPKSWRSHSSSLESDSDSEGGKEDEYKHAKNLHDSDVELNENKGSSSGKSEILYLIEQLLMLECFSREECDRLMKIINLRVVDHVMREGMNARINPTISKKVIMEARKTIAENPVGSSLKSDLDDSTHGSKSLVTRNRDYHSGGSRNIQNEVQRSHSKAIVLVKPNKLLPGNETANTDQKDRRATQDDVSTKALPIKEKHLIAYEKDLKDDKAGDDVNRVEENCDMITEYAELANVIHASQGSSNTNDPTAATRTRKYNTRRGRPRAK